MGQNNSQTRRTSASIQTPTPQLRSEFDEYVDRNHFQEIIELDGINPPLAQNGGRDTGDYTLGDLVTNAELMEYALSTLESESDISGLCFVIAVKLLGKFEQTRSIEDIERAVKLAERAVESQPNDDPDRPKYLTILATAFQGRFDLMGLMDDLNRAIAAIGRAILCAPNDHPDRAAYLGGLATALQNRFERTGLIDDLNQAIAAYERAA